MPDAGIITEDTPIREINRAEPPTRWITENATLCIWIVSVFVGVGIYIATVLGLKDSLKDVKSSVNQQQNKVNIIGAQISGIQASQKNIQKDVSLIKNILMGSKSHGTPCYTYYSDDVIAKIKE